MALQSVLEQRTFYPCYPGNPNTPVDWEQYKHKPQAATRLSQSTPLLCPKLTMRAKDCPTK